MLNALTRMPAVVGCASIGVSFPVSNMFWSRVGRLFSRLVIHFSLAWSSGPLFALAGDPAVVDVGPLFRLFGRGDGGVAAGVGAAGGDRDSAIFFSQSLSTWERIRRCPGHLSLISTVSIVFNVVALAGVIGVDGMTWSLGGEAGWLGVDLPNVSAWLVSLARSANSGKSMGPSSWTRGGG